VKRRVLGVLAGQDMPLTLLGSWAASAEMLLAADSGADRLVEAGYEPHKIVGDLDSVTTSTLVLGAEIVQDQSLDFTDCDKLLRLAADEGYEEITLASVEGDLPDHFLATMQSAARAKLSVRFAMRRGVGWLVRSDRDLALDSQPGRRLSLLPLSETTGVRLTGVAWELNNADLQPHGMTSISNRTVNSLVTARVGTGTAFLFLEFPPEEIPFW
jgi:thiamine pyrophosphokinase